MDLTAVSQESLAALAKAATAGITASTGLTGFDLSPWLSQIPVNTPFRDFLPRTKVNQGAKFAEWRVLLNVNNTQPDPGTAWDYSAPVVNVSEQDVTALYAKLGAGYTVTKDSIALAGGYADAKAIAILNALNQFKIGEDKKAIGGCNFSIGTPATPTLTASSTGGSIAASTAVPVKVAARTASNYFWGGSTAASAQASVTTAAGTATNSVTATVAAQRGAVAYDWFVNGFYYTTTTVNSVTITSVPTANASVPTLPDLYSVAPSSVPTTDSSAKANDFNGQHATLAGDYATGGSTGLVTPGSGVPSGAYFGSLNGNKLSISGGSITEIDNLFQSLFDAARVSPDALMVSSQQAREISSAIIGTTAAPTFFTPGMDGRTDAVMGGFVGHYVNAPAGGVPVKIEVHPHMPPGTLIARTDRVPYPNSIITNTLEIRCVDEIQDFEYGVSRNAGVAGGGPRFDGETYASETLVNKAPLVMGVLQNIA